MAVIFGPDAFVVGADINIDAYPSGSPDYAYCQGSGSNCIVQAANDRIETNVGGVDIVARVINSAAPSSLANYEVRGDIYIKNGNAVSAIALRYSTTSRGYSVEFDNTQAVRLIEDNAGFSLLGFGNRAVAIDTTYPTSLRAIGTTGGTLLTAIINNLIAVTFVDTTAPASGFAGLHLFSVASTDTAAVDNLVVDDLAGYPLVAGVASTNGSTATVSPVVNLPSACQAGETLLMIIRDAAGGTVTWPSGWNELFENSADASDDTTAVAWKKATGAEGATLTMTSAFSVSGKFAAICYRILNAADPSVRAPEFSTVVTGSSTTPDPGAITPTGGSKKYLFIWMGGWEGIQTSPPASFPTNYNSPVGADSGTASTLATNCRVACAYREAEVSSEDPGSWTLSASDDWTATVVAIHPVAVTTVATPSPKVITNVSNHRAASW